MLFKQLFTSSIAFPHPSYQKKMSPYEALFGDTPNYSKLRVFGCVCYPWLRPYAKNKLEPRSRLCIFLGHSLTQSAYKCFDPTTNRVFISRHVIFDETIFPFASFKSALPRVTSATSQYWFPTVLADSPSFFTMPVMHGSPHRSPRLAHDAPSLPNHTFQPSLIRCSRPSPRTIQPHPNPAPIQLIIPILNDNHHPTHLSTSTEPLSHLNSYTSLVKSPTLTPSLSSQTNPLTSLPQSSLPNLNSDSNQTWTTSSC